MGGCFVGCVQWLTGLLVHVCGLCVVVWPAGWLAGLQVEPCLYSVSCFNFPHCPFPCHLAAERARVGGAAADWPALAAGLPAGRPVRGDGEPCSMLYQGCPACSAGASPAGLGLKGCMVVRAAALCVHVTTCCCPDSCAAIPAQQQPSPYMLDPTSLLFTAGPGAAVVCVVGAPQGAHALAVHLQPHPQPGPAHLHHPAEHVRGVCAPRCRVWLAPSQGSWAAGVEGLKEPAFGPGKRTPAGGGRGSTPAPRLLWRGGRV